MRALLSTRPGPASCLELRDIPEPMPGPRAVRIAVAACGVNYPDVLLLEDLYQYKPERPFAPGAEVAGTVDAVGSEVSSLAPGDRVVAWVGWGGMAEKITCPEASCTILPAGVPFDAAAALLMTYSTAHYALHDRAALKEGQTLLVLGAAGGVGLAAVEIGALVGARVVAAVSSADKAHLARDYGAQAVVIYPRVELDVAAAKKLTAELRAACGPGSADVIYDPVGGPYTEPALRAISWGGRHLIIGFTAGIAQLPMNLPLLKGCDILGVFSGGFFERDGEGQRRKATELVALLAAGKLRPFIGGRFPLERGGEAIERMRSREALGKMVITLP